MITRSLILAVIAFAGACAAPRATYFGHDFSALYRRVEVSAAGAQGPVPLIVRGNPFGGSPSGVAAATLGALSRAGALHPLRLTVGDPGPRSVDYRLIVVFGQPRLGFNGPCADPDAPFAQEAGVNATAAFCIGRRMLSTVRARSYDAIGGPDDPAFAMFLHGLATELFPSDNPKLQRCGFRFTC